LGKKPEHINALRICPIPNAGERLLKREAPVASAKNR
jgi:hypothetical protein